MGSYLEVRNYLSRAWAASRPWAFTASIMMSDTAEQRRREERARVSWSSRKVDEAKDGWRVTNVGGGRKVGERKRKIAMQLEGGDTSLGGRSVQRADQ